VHTIYCPTTCPHCGAGLTEAGAVEASFSDGRKYWQRSHEVIAGVVRLVDGPTPESPPESWSPLSDPSGEVSRELFREAKCHSCQHSLTEDVLADPEA
jgi:hypothetical protein